MDNKFLSLQDIKKSISRIFPMEHPDYTEIHRIFFLDLGSYARRKDPKKRLREFIIRKSYYSRRERRTRLHL